MTDEQIDALACEMVKGGKSVNWLAHAIKEAVLAEQDKLNEEYDAVLRGLASYVGAGGFNDLSPLIDPQVADEKIRWGIDHILNIEQAKQEPAAFQAREIGEGDWYDVDVGDVSRITAIINSPLIDYRWLYTAAIVQPDDLKDAARYRWLRDSPFGLPISAAAAREPGAFDAAIDAAMAKEQK